MKNNVAIYCRIAKGSNECAASFAMDVQRRALERYAGIAGMAVVGIYDDIGSASGTRPGLQRLIADAAAGKFDTVFVYKLDRLFRRPPAIKLPFKVISLLEKEVPAWEPMQ